MGGKSFVITHLDLNTSLPSTEAMNTPAQLGSSLLGKRKAQHDSQGDGISFILYTQTNVLAATENT